MDSKEKLQPAATRNEDDVHVSHEGDSCCKKIVEKKDEPRFAFLIGEGSIFDVEYEFYTFLSTLLTGLNKWNVVAGFLIHVFIRNAGILFNIVMMGALFYYAHWRVCPEICSEFESEFWYYASLLFVFQIFTSLFMARRNEVYNQLAHWRKKPLVADTCRRLQEEAEREAVLRQDGAASEKSYDKCGFLISGYGKICSICEQDAPMRSHHCPLCKVCILRKDHHCFVTGGCIGLGNQRYFFSWLFWMMITLVCCMPYFFRYTNQAIMPWYPFGWMSYIGPLSLIRFLTGYETFSNALYMIVLTFGTLGFCGSLFMMTVQLFYMSEGFTMYEFHSGRFRKYYKGDGSSIPERLRLVLGRNWLLTILFPLFYQSEPELTPSIAENIFRNLIPRETETVETVEKTNDAVVDN